MTFRILLLIAFFLLATTVSSSAEIYKYRDAEGVLRFTNNLQEVPKDQRKQVQSYHEIESEKETEVDPAQKDAAQGQKTDLDEAADALREEKESLDAEYAKLEEDRKLLVELSQEEKNSEEEAEFSKKIESFNARTKAYDEKRKAFEQKVKEYNASIQ